MRQRLSILESITLSWVSMDHESLDTIIGNVSSDYGKNISKKSLEDVLVGLQSKGLVEPYIYSPTQGKFVSQELIGSFPQDDIWWLMTKKGAQVLENQPAINLKQII